MIPKDAEKAIAEHFTIPPEIRRLANHTLYDCEICGSYHPWNWDGDCRDDDNRYAGTDDYAERHGVSEFEIEVRSMDERLAND